MKSISKKSRPRLLICIIIISLITAVTFVMAFIQRDFSYYLIESAKDFSQCFSESDAQIFLDRLSYYSDLPSSAFNLWIIFGSLFAIVDVVLLVIFVTDIVSYKRSDSTSDGMFSCDKKRLILTIIVAALSALMLSIAVLTAAQSQQCYEVMDDVIPSINYYVPVIDEYKHEYLIGVMEGKHAQYLGTGMSISIVLLCVDIGAAIWLVCDIKKSKKQSQPPAETK